jgi:hypothetical protein
MPLMIQIFLTYFILNKKIIKNQFLLVEMSNTYDPYVTHTMGDDGI